MTARRLSLIRHAVQTSGPVVDHHSQSGRNPRFTLDIELPRDFDRTPVAVDVDSETYDRTWIGDRATFYVDRSDPENTSQDPPSLRKLLGFVLGCLAMGGLFVGAVLKALFEPAPTFERERKVLAELAVGKLTVDEFKPFDAPVAGGLVTGTYARPDGTRLRLRHLVLRRLVSPGDVVPILYGDDAKSIQPLEDITTVEPSPTRPL